jgi:hypothetical protein
MGEVPRNVDLHAIGEDVPLLEGIRTSSAIRRLRPDPVPRGLIRKVVEAGTFAPSGGNRQPWSFIAVTERALRARIAERYREVFFPYIAPAVEASRAPGFDVAKRKVLAGAVHLAEHLHEAPVLLFAVGLGASLTTVHLAFRSEVDAWLGLPENQPSCAMLPIGWPAVPYRRPVRRSVDRCLFFERYDPGPGRVEDESPDR